MRSRVFPLAIISVLTPICFAVLRTPRSTQSASVSQQQELSEACPATKPLSQPFVPPPPYWTNHGPNQFWYGTESLWTLLGVHGVCHVDKDGRYGTKLTYWQRGFDWRKERPPKLVINARRLDHDAPVIVIDHANAVFVTGSAPAAMMTAIDIPTPGCWEITAKYKDQKLSFVVSLQP